MYTLAALFASYIELRFHRTWYPVSESNTSGLFVGEVHTTSLLTGYRKLVGREGLCTFSRQVKSLLCYFDTSNPLKIGRSGRTWIPPTPRLKVGYSIQLSYKAKIIMAIRYPGFYHRLSPETFIHLSREPDRSYLGYPALFRVAAEVECLRSND